VTGKKPYTYVHSTFVQPTITCPGVADQYTSNWVGLDGYNDETVEQDGTAACSSCERASAEWIVERPALCNNALTKCFITELADFGTSTMSGDGKSFTATWQEPGTTVPISL
jgi:hypothetical protein